jgi:arginine-tRNA-protein transferase
LLVVQEFQSQENCSYLKNKEQLTHYKVIKECSIAYSQALIERGYRRFGHMYFRPICSTCNECQSIKIDVKNFQFSKSARRILRKGEHLKIYIQKPTLTQKHLEIFDDYHRYMHHKKGWDYTPTTPQHYFNSFVAGAEDFGYEVLYFEEEKLIAVDLIDILEDGISSIYFYYNPLYSHLSLGKLSLYKQIQLAEVNTKAWIYLGYYVKECPSLAYKAQYQPYLTLEGRPREDDEVKWF